MLEQKLLSDYFDTFEFGSLPKESAITIQNTDRLIHSTINFSDKDSISVLAQDMIKYYASADTFLSTEKSIDERDLMRHYGFDFNLVDFVVNYFKKSFDKYKLLTERTFIVKSVFNRSYVEVPFFPAVITGYHLSPNYYTNEIYFGMFADSNIITYQFFFEIIDHKIVPKAKICFPLNETDYFTVIIGTSSDLDLAYKIIYENLFHILRIVLKHKYPSECSNIFEENDSVVAYFLEVQEMLDL